MARLIRRIRWKDKIEEQPLAYGKFWVVTEQIKVA